MATADYPVLDDIAANTSATASNTSSIKTSSANTAATSAAIKSDTETIIEGINLANSLLTDIRAEVPDIRKKVVDVRIERIYIGDREANRELAAQELQSLLAEGYRPYIVFGISEDLARVAFAKYTSWNAPITD